MLLALDASLESQSATIFSRKPNGYELLTTIEQKGTSSQFVSMLQELFTKAQLQPSEIKELAVISGPGSFTGIRTALTVAKTLAAQISAPVYAVNNFELLRPSTEPFALKLSEHDYYVSLNTNYQDAEANFFANSAPENISINKNATTNLSSLIGNFLNANPRQALQPTEVTPYYLRLPHIGVKGESRVKTQTGLELKVDKNNLETLYAEARQAMTETRFADAVQLMKLYISRNKKNLKPIAYELLAEAELELADFSAAKRHFLKAGNLTQAAFAAMVSGKMTEARHLYLKAPVSIAQRWGLFICDYLQPQHQAPIDSPGFMAFRLFLESTVSYMLRAKLERYVDTLFDNAQALEAVFPELRKAIGSAYLGVKNYPMAVAILQTCKDTLSHDAELYYKLAEAEIALGDKVAAENSLKQVLKLLPGHIGSEKLLATLN